MQFEEIWKTEEKLNQEKEIERVSENEMKEKANGAQRALAKVCNLFLD
jgi:hypothetical protein